MLEKESKIISLFSKIQCGDQLAFNELFNHYYPKLIAFAQQYTKQLERAEEITSELFVKIWLKRQALDQVQNPEVYLYISIKNACLNLIRSDKRRINLLPEEDGKALAERMHGHALNTIEDKELLKLLDAAVSSLPEQRKLIFKLIKEDGLKPIAIAQILGISKRTVENQLYKAVKTLAEAISSYLGYHPQAKAAKKQALSEIAMVFFC